MKRETKRMHVVEVEDLGRSYGDFEALKSVSFQIREGEIVGLLGPNGAGKSTTMKILTSYLAPTSGWAKVCGHDVLYSPREVHANIGYLPEQAPLYEEMEVEEYLRFCAKVRGLAKGETALAIERTARDCGLEDRLRQSISTLSKGYRQRVGLAQALLHQPKLLILDEPTSGLDPNQIVEIRGLIQRLAESRTIILSTHILSEVQATCDRVLIIHHGELVADGVAEDVIAGSSGWVIFLTLSESPVILSEAQVVEQLGTLEGVGHVRLDSESEDGRRFVIHAQTDVRRACFEWAVAKGQLLVEISVDRASLEDVFRRLTVGATPA